MLDWRNLCQTGGTITADNKAIKGKGKAVYIDIGGGKNRIRNRAAGPKDNLDSRVVGRAGGWE